jgi:hypothetical protein
VLPAIAADAALAWVVQAGAGRLGANERTRLGAAALVAFGPSFALISGYHGQIDSVAILPAVLALMLWERSPTSARAVKAGLLVGLGAAVKLPPLLLVSALLGSARSSREAAKLVGGALAIPAIVLAPLWVSGVDLHGVISYKGVPGWGGPSLIADPGLGWDWLTGPGFPEPNGIVNAMQDASRWIIAAMLVAFTAFIVRYRPAPIDAAVLLWLVTYAINPNFFLNYLVWGLPFFIMAGYLVEAAVLQLAVIPAMIGYYLVLSQSRSDVNGFLYVPSLIALWLFFLVASFVLARRIVRRRATHRSGIQPPLVAPAAEIIFESEGPGTRA